MAWLPFGWINGLVYRQRGGFTVFWSIAGQVLAFTPIAFLVLIGVVQGISPSMEGGSADLARLALNGWDYGNMAADAAGPQCLLIGFVESLADFEILWFSGGNFEVLATANFYAVVGSQNDAGRSFCLIDPRC